MNLKQIISEIISIELIKNKFKTVNKNNILQFIMYIIKEYKLKNIKYNYVFMPVESPYLPYRTVKKTIDINDYYISTKATFKSILHTQEDYDNVFRIWDKIKEKGEYKQSPLSKSEYIITKNNDIYRLSDHWGNVASCIWDLDMNIYTEHGKYDIGVCNIKDFKLHDNDDVIDYNTYMDFAPSKFNLPNKKYIKSYTNYIKDVDFIKNIMTQLKTTESSYKEFNGIFGLKRWNEIYTELKEQLKKHG